MRRNWQAALGLVWTAALLAGWASASGAQSDPASSGGAPPDQQANAPQEVQASPKPGNHVDDAQAAYRSGDYATALRISLALAEQGDAAAQAMLGVIYAEGRGVARDDAEAVKWDQKAAEQGLADGQDHLGSMYEVGRGVAKDDSEAVKWYRKAAEQGLARGQDHLGLMYARGRGVAKDDAEAVKWHRKAADQGDARAQNHLGFMFAQGRGVAKDDAEAVKWYRNAAEQGLAVAQYNLGLHYAQGRGIEKDDAEAVKWYRKASESGNARAQKYLGDMYAKGLGVPVDVSEAGKWYRKAAAQQDREAALTKELAVQEGESGADQIHRVGGDVTAPKLVNRVEPAYPKAARRELIEGVVVLEAIISASGNVTNIAVLKSVHPLIDEAAVHAVRQWRYSPATLNGNPVRVYLTVTVTFNLGLMPPMPPRPSDSLFGNWQVPGQRIWVWIGQDNRAYQCRITSADVVSKAAGIVEQTPEGKIIRWQRDWPSDSVRRDGGDLLLTSSEGSIRFRPFGHYMAPSCGQK